MQHATLPLFFALITPMDIGLAIVLALVFAFVAAWLYPPMEDVLRDSWAVITLFWAVNRTGLKAIYVRSDPRSMKPLKRILRQAKTEEEIIVVGRTQGLFLADNSELIRKALARGVTFKLLLLDIRALNKVGPGQRVDLRSLQLHDAHRKLAADLGTAEFHLRNLRNECEKHSLAGHLLVFRTDVLIQSSVVVYQPSNGGAKRIFYDFSFGEAPFEKFIQCYKSDKRARSFSNRLLRFYARMFDLDASSFAYDLSYRPSPNWGLKKELDHIGSERMQELVNAHTEAEAIRENTLTRLLPAARDVFLSIDKKATAPAPVSVQLELTNTCSTKCSHCSRFSLPKPTSGSAGLEPRAEMDFLLAQRILTELSQLKVGSVTFSGGEPTQHSQFVDILELAKSMKLRVGVLSNGVGLSDTVLKSIHENADWLRLSIDGSNANVYGEIRHAMSGENAFSQVEHTLDEFRRLDSLAHRCKLSICYTIQRNNADDVPDMIRWVREKGVPGGDKSLTFKFAHGSNGFLCREPQIAKLREVFAQSEFVNAANSAYLLSFMEHQSSVRDIANGRPTETLYREKDTRCFSPYLFALIDADGDVYPCCFLFEDNQGYTPGVIAKREQHRMGSMQRVNPQTGLVEKKTFQEIWRGVRYNGVRNDLAVIVPEGKYHACGECTRHCNHNQWLSKLYEEYAGLRLAEADGDAAIRRIIQETELPAPWL